MKTFVKFIFLTIVALCLSIVCLARPVAGDNARSDATNDNAVTNVNSKSHGTNFRSNNTVIEFDKGQSDLTEASKDALRDLVNNTHNAGQIDSVEVAVWSDQPAGADDLNGANRSLAADRANQVQAYLKGALDVSNVVMFNMAEDSNWLVRNFDSTPYELRSVFSKEGAPEMSRSDFNIFHEEGSPGKAVIVLKKKAHK